MTRRMVCPHCDLEFDIDSMCNGCGRDCEGFTQEDRMKPLNKKYVADSHLLDIQKAIKKKKRKSKRVQWDNDPFPGRSSKVRILK